MDLSKLSDRELLEGIYLMSIQILTKVGEIDDDSKQLIMNTIANLFADKIAFNK